MKISTAFAIGLSLALSAPVYCDSTAYVASGVTVNPNSQGSISPYYPKTGKFGGGIFVPLGGASIAVHPKTGQIWQVAAPGGSPSTVNVLDPRTGAIAATIPLNEDGLSVSIDSAGARLRGNKLRSDPNRLFDL
jgi:DNA-binding beta-propeller fold protein YncE